jgi:hypothetical protein
VSDLLASGSTFTARLPELCDSDGTEGTLCTCWLPTLSCGDSAAASANGIASVMTSPKAITLLNRQAEILICHQIPSSLHFKTAFSKAAMPNDQILVVKHPERIDVRHYLQTVA